LCGPVSKVSLLETVMSDIETLLDTLAEKIAAKIVAAPPAPPPSEWRTPIEAAALLKLRPQTLEQWRHKGVGPRYHKLVRGVRYKQADLDEFLASSGRRSTSEPVRPRKADPAPRPRKARGPK
jgi:hypothetical protein